MLAFHGEQMTECELVVEMEMRKEYKESLKSNPKSFSFSSCEEVIAMGRPPPNLENRKKDTNWQMGRFIFKNILSSFILAH